MHIEDTMREPTIRRPATPIPLPHVESRPDPSMGRPWLRVHDGPPGLRSSWRFLERRGLVAVWQSPSGCGSMRDGQHRGSDFAVVRHVGEGFELLALVKGSTTRTDATAMGMARDLAAELARDV